MKITIHTNKYEISHIHVTIFWGLVKRGDMNKPLNVLMNELYEYITCTTQRYTPHSHFKFVEVSNRSGDLNFRVYMRIIQLCTCCTNVLIFTSTTFAIGQNILFLPVDSMRTMSPMDIVELVPWLFGLSRKLCRYSIFHLFTND